MKTNFEHYGEVKSTEATSNMLNQRHQIDDCRHCRLSLANNTGEGDRVIRFSRLPYGQPIDMRIPWRDPDSKTAKLVAMAEYLADVIKKQWERRR